MTTGTLLREPGAEIILQSAAPAALTNGSFVRLATAPVASTDNPNFPLLDFFFTGTWIDAVGINDGELRLYKRRLDPVDGDEPEPSLNNPRTIVGNFVPDIVTIAQNLKIEGVVRGLILAEEYWLENATGKDLSLGYTVKAKPNSYAPSAA